MVTESKTEVSSSETPTSETAAAASKAGQQAEQQPENEGQRAEESPEKGPLDTFWEGLSPESRVEFAKKLKGDEISQNPEYQEHLRREEQRARSNALNKQRDADRLRHEDDAIQQGHQDAEKALDAAVKEGETDKLPGLARKLAEAKARAEYWPSMRDDLFRAPSRTPYAEHMTPEEKEALIERQGDVGAQIDHSFGVFADAVARIVTGQVEERLKGEKAEAEKAATDVEHQRWMALTRGPVPPNLGSEGALAGGMTFEQFDALPLDEQAKVTPSERARIYAEHDRRTART